MYIYLSIKKLTFHCTSLCSTKIVGIYAKSSMANNDLWLM